MNAKKSLSNNTSLALNSLILDCIQEKKGNDIVHIDLTHLEDSPTEQFIVCHGESSTQVKAIADFITDEVKQKTGQIPNHVEGQNNSFWILIDYFDIIVHVFYKETREFYKLEELWADGKVTSVEN